MGARNKKKKPRNEREVGSTEIDKSLIMIIYYSDMR